MSLKESKINKYCWIFIWNKKKRKEFRNNNLIIPNHYGVNYIYPEEYGNEIILNVLNENKPTFITRFGATELSIIRFFYNNIKNYNMTFPDNLKEQIKKASGFFSPTDEYLTRFCCESINMIKNIDVIGVWNFKDDLEEKLLHKYNQNAKLVSISSIGDLIWKFDSPWTQYLKNKKVLVIHPFEKTIIQQYQKRELLFKNPLTLPEFKLKTIKAVQGICGSEETKKYENWFKALNSMYQKIDQTDFDIALIGAGAYGMFLANYIKHKGKQAIHVGGALQLLFGIKGSRWTKEYTGNFSQNFVNEHWTYPLKEDTPSNIKELTKYEKSTCYW